MMMPMVDAELVREFNSIINCYYSANYSWNKFSCLRRWSFAYFAFPVRKFHYYFHGLFSFILMWFSVESSRSLQRPRVLADTLYLSHGCDVWVWRSACQKRYDRLWVPSMCACVVFSIKLEALCSQSSNALVQNYERRKKKRGEVWIIIITHKWCIRSVHHHQLPAKSFVCGRVCVCIKG